MSKGYFTLKGKLKYLKGTFLILTIFTIDCLLGSVSLFMGQAETMDEWVSQVQIFCMARSIFAWIPYMLLLYLIRAEVKIDWVDESLIVLCLIMSVLDTSDYLTNGGWRPVWMDYAVFTIFALTLLGIKIYRTGKRLN